MSRCLCCCISLQKGVIVIGVVCTVAATLLTASYAVKAVTFEKHVEACSSTRDIVSQSSVFPSCSLLQDISFVVASRIYYYVLTSMWILFLIFSSVLICAAVKEQTGLLVPWIVVMILVMGAEVWKAVKDALENKIFDLVLTLLSLAVAVYFVFVVHAFSKHLQFMERTHLYFNRRCCNLSHFHRGGDDDPFFDLPPAYFARPLPPFEKTGIPKSLGFRT